MNENSVREILIEMNILKLVVDKNRFFKTIKLLDERLRSISKKGEKQMLISKDSAPTESIIYTVGCILKTYKKNVKAIYNAEELYRKIISQNEIETTFSNFCLAIDLLFLIDKVKLEDGYLHYVY